LRYNIEGITLDKEGSYSQIYHLVVEEDEYIGKIMIVMCVKNIKLYKERIKYMQAIQRK